MADNVYDLSTTAGSNSSVGGMNWAEGQAPSTVNDSARQFAALVAQLLGDIGGALVAGGTANGLTVTANSAFTTLANGRLIAFRAASDNTTAATLNVNGIGAKSIRKMLSTGDVALTGGEIQADGIYVAQYSAALNGAAGGWLLVNPTLTSAALGTLGLATSSTDNAMVRFDGTAGGTQNSVIIVGDTGNVTGMGTLASGAITSSGGISGTTGTFSGAISGAAISGTSGTFSTTLAVTGLTTVSQPIRAANETAAAPSYSFTNAATSGMFLAGTNTLGWSIASAEQMRLSTTALTVSENPSAGVDASGTNAGFAMGTDGQMIIYVVNDAPMLIGRSNSGTLVQWRVAGVTVGVISESGGVITYGTFRGAHPAQWVGPETTLRGTVVESVDELSEWASGILPKVKVSDVPGSLRVYGVYSHEDDKMPGFFHVSSLGADVIRIEAGEVVRGGDLIESAGNGCGRVQPGKGISSRTVGKVTANVVIERYPDGSYLVPCVLYCG